MLHNILPTQIADALQQIGNVDKLYEVRLRADLPMMVCYNGKFLYVHKDGFSRVVENAICVNAKTIEEILFRAAEQSLYAVTKQINHGYLTIKGGIRIGIAGEVVYDKEEIRAVKNFNALNIRIPHEVVGCSDKVFRHLHDHIGPLNTLLISPPGAGKTTMLRDIARQWSHCYPLQNVLVIDERSEIGAVYESVPQLFVGHNTDIISNCNKQYAFEYAIRAMRPDIIITDEISTKQDYQSIGYALSCGVKVIASIHARTHQDLLKKADFRESVLDTKLMDRFIVLSNKSGPGSIEGVYNDGFERIA